MRLYCRTSPFKSDFCIYCLHGIREKAPPSSAAEGINLNRPLAEITREVVLRVYELEGQNQTKTAQHLDISRSTLWRMLK